MLTRGGAVRIDAAGPDRASGPTSLPALGSGGIERGFRTAGMQVGIPLGAQTRGVTAATGTVADAPRSGKEMARRFGAGPIARSAGRAPATAPLWSTNPMRAGAAVRATLAAIGMLDRRVRCRLRDGGGGRGGIGLPANGPGDGDGSSDSGGDDKLAHR
jgi:hypothetical protein